MDKNSIIGFVLIFLIMMGFFGYQSHQVKKQQAYQAQLDSIAAAEAYAQWQQDSIWRANNPEAAAALDEAVSTPVLLSSSSLMRCTSVRLPFSSATCSFAPASSFCLF